MRIARGNRICTRHFRHNGPISSLRVVTSQRKRNALVHFRTSPRVFSRAARCRCSMLTHHLQRRTFLGTKLSVALASGQNRRPMTRRFYCRNNVQRFMGCVGAAQKLGPVRSRIVRVSAAGSSHDTRITLYCASDCGRALLSFTGGVGAVSNNARRAKFGATLAQIFGSCNGGFGVLGRGSGGLSNSSIHRKLATIVDIGLARTRFRNRAGNGLNGASVANLIDSLMCSGLVACFRRGPTMTGTLLSGSLSTSHTERTTHGTESGTHGGAKLRDDGLPNGLTSYSSGSPSLYRVCVIRNSSTNNSTGSKQSHTRRTVLPL